MRADGRVEAHRPVLLAGKGEASVATSAAVPAGHAGSSLPLLLDHAARDPRAAATVRLAAGRCNCRRRRGSSAPCLAAASTSVIRGAVAAMLAVPSGLATMDGQVAQVAVALGSEMRLGVLRVPMPAGGPARRRSRPDRSGPARSRRSAWTWKPCSPPGSPGQLAGEGRAVVGRRDGERADRIADALGGDRVHGDREFLRRSRAGERRGRLSDRVEIRHELPNVLTPQRAYAPLPAGHPEWRTATGRLSGVP